MCVQMFVHVLVCICFVFNTALLSCCAICCRYDVECTVTSVASHPSQTCIATGNRIGQIHLWYVKMSVCVPLSVCMCACVCASGVSVCAPGGVCVHLVPIMCAYGVYV